VASNPTLHEESGPKELADLIIPIDDILFVIQSKSLDLDTSEIDDIKANRVVKRIENAKKQLSTPLNAWKRGSRVTYANAIGIETEIDWQEIKKIVGIITINIQDPHFHDPEFRLSLPMYIEEHKNIDVHVFMLRDLHHMSEELTTPMDFVFYLNDRKYLALSGKLWVGNELDLLGFLKMRYDWVEQIKEGTINADTIAIEPGTWEALKKNTKALTMSRYNHSHSMIIDRFISELRTTIGFSIERGEADKVTATKNYYKIVSFLSKTRRIERRELGKKIAEKLKNTKIRNESYFLHIMPEEDLTLLFIASNQLNRELRKNLLHNFSVSGSQVVTTKHFLAIATEGAKARGFSLDPNLIT
jgi:hypothetical protein